MPRLIPGLIPGLISSLTALATLALLSACAAPPQLPQQPQVGSDRDAQGCKASAGYSWCARTQQCERPWELAQKQSFANTGEAFAQYCRAAPR